MSFRESELPFYLLPVMWFFNNVVGGVVVVAGDDILLYYMICYITYPLVCCFWPMCLELRVLAIMVQTQIYGSQRSQDQTLTRPTWGGWVGGLVGVLS